MPSVEYSIENAQKFRWSSVTGDLNVERVAHLEQFVTGESILDAGCGGGAYVEFLAEKGYQVTGVDLHAKFLKIAHQRKSAGTYVEADITALPFSDKSFDFSYCFDVLEHVDDVKAVKELLRVTRERVLFAVPKVNTVADYNLTFLHYSDMTHLRYYTEQAIKDLLAGFEMRSLHIYSELNVPIKELFFDHSQVDLQRFLRVYFYSRVFRRVLPMWLKHRQPLQECFRRARQDVKEVFLKALLSHVTIKEVPTGLVAVIDL